MRGLWGSRLRSLAPTCSSRKRIRSQLRPLSREPTAATQGDLSQAVAGGLPSPGDPRAVENSAMRGWMQPLGLANLRRAKLADGLEVIALARPGSPFHTVLLAFHGGSAMGEPTGVGIAATLLAYGA